VRAVCRWQNKVSQESMLSYYHLCNFVGIFGRIQSRNQCAKGVSNKHEWT